ncbi:putative cation-transporting ATPase 1 [Malassezia psittaci]|uniref:Cation-transporting ATPase 1 n=1 Tax=Malassezia psittaci TaxID=1821823 RepID=A0AAF0JFU5_9BASI|nr:putative cation-transporting ATPase 1 [Malassezia psittaci]
MRLPRPLLFHLYIFPYLFLYPLLAYAYYVEYDRYIRSEEWTFVYTVLLTSSHALSFLVTRWNVRARALITSTIAHSLSTADRVQIVPHAHKGEGTMVPLNRIVRQGERDEYSFVCQADKYVLAVPDSKASVTSITASPDIREPTFRRLLYPADVHPKFSEFLDSPGLNADQINEARKLYGNNLLEIPVPKFWDLFFEHAVAPFFVFQVFCVGLWMLDEYWYSSLFSLFALVAFECTTVFQRQRTLNEFRTMSIQPFAVNVYRKNTWVETSTDDLLPGDVVSVQRTKQDSALPCDLLLLSGSAIVNEAMLSGESTPLLKESIAQRNDQDTLDDQNADRLHCLFGGTKALQVTPGQAVKGVAPPPDDGAIGLVLRTGFGTTQGRLVRLMVFTNENQVTANNWESFVFIAFLLVFAIAASAYVWKHGLEMGRPKGKLLLHCVLIITSVVPAELPMELSMSVNASLTALGRFAIFCTEPFRIPYAGRVDVCCFDKTGTITGEDLEVQGVVGSSDPSAEQLEPVLNATPETTLVLASAHALVMVDDEVVGDPMEKRTVEAIGWKLKKGDYVVPTSESSTPKEHNVQIRLRFHFSSALKRMSTIAQVSLNNKKSHTMLASVKGAPETLRSMFSELPPNYDTLYRDYTRRGSRVIALGYKYMDHLNANSMRNLRREDVECDLKFAGFLVLHCPLKDDAVQSLKQLNDSAHRCVMITGDNALTGVHIAEEVEIITRDAIILDRADGGNDSELVWHKANDEVVRKQDVDAPLHRHLFDEYDVVVTGAALKPYESRPEQLKELVENTCVYARVSPTQKELVLSTLKSLKYITLMAGDGTNDVGALKMANIGVALLDGSPEDLKKIAQHQMLQRQRKAYEAQLSLMARWNQPPPPVPQALKEAFPELEQAREKALVSLQTQRRTNPVAKFDMSSITQSMNAIDQEEEGPPQIRLGDASVAAPFTSKLSNVSAVCAIIRQGRCTLVATIQMYKILALNCLIQAYALSAQYIDGIRSGDYQLTVSGLLASVCFYCISRGQPIESLAPERPVSNIVNLYVFGSVMTQTVIHVVSMLVVQRLTLQFEAPFQPEDLDIAAKFTPTLLNTGVFLLGLSQTMSTFAVNYIGRPWRESIQENKVLYWGLLGTTGVAYLGVLEWMPELNEWLQLTKMQPAYQRGLLITMLADLLGCYVAERFWKLFADVQPRKMVLTGQRNRALKRAKAEVTQSDKKLD